MGLIERLTRGNTSVFTNTAALEAMKDGAHTGAAVARGTPAPAMVAAGGIGGGVSYFRQVVKGFVGPIAEATKDARIARENGVSRDEFVAQGLMKNCGMSRDEALAFVASRKDAPPQPREPSQNPLVRSFVDIRAAARGE